MRAAQPAAEIVRRLGGKGQLAEDLNVTRQAVEYWMTPLSRRGSGGRIPAKYHPLLIELAKQKGVRLSYEDFHAQGKPPAPGE